MSREMVSFKLGAYLPPAHHICTRVSTHGLPQGARYRGVRSLKVGVHRVAVVLLTFHRHLATRISRFSSVEELKMSHLLYWPGRSFFYPLGNTSAVCLTESLPPEHNADVLLLGCGDPRHILHTLYADATRSRPGRQLAIHALCMRLTTHNRAS